MSNVEKRRTALAERLGVPADELRTPADAPDDGTAFELLPGGVYRIYSPDDEKKAFKARVPDVPFVAQVRDDAGQTYNVYLSVGVLGGALS